MNKASYNKITINNKNIIINSNQHIVINSLGQAKILDKNKVILEFSIYQDLKTQMPLYSSFLVKTGDSITTFKKDFGKRFKSDKQIELKYIQKAAQFFLDTDTDLKVDFIDSIKSSISFTDDFVVYVSTTNPKFIFSIYYHGHIYRINK